MVYALNQYYTASFFFSSAIGYKHRNRLDDETPFVSYFQDNLFQFSLLTEVLRQYQELLANYPLKICKM